MNQKKSAPYKMHAPSLLTSKPRTQSSYKFVSSRMVCLEIFLTSTCRLTFPGKHRNPFLQPPKLRQHPSSRGFLPKLPQHSLTMIFLGSRCLSKFYGAFLVGRLSGAMPVLHRSMMEPQKSFREGNLVPEHGHDFNTRLCAA